MDREELEQRTRAFAVRIIRLVAALPQNRTGDVLGRQLLRAGTAIGANYAEAARASSKRHFVTTMEIAQRECAETLYWLELLVDAGVMTASRLKELNQECRELLAILTASIRTAKRTSATQIRNTQSAIRNTRKS